MSRFQVLLQPRATTYPPGFDGDGGLSEESQRKALDLILQVQGIKETLPLERFFDFAIQKRLSAEFRGKNWKPSATS